MKDGVCLRGLDGSNPLAFLAALGVLRGLTLDAEARTESAGAADDEPAELVRMWWTRERGVWTPWVSGEGLTSEDEVLDRLHHSPMNAELIHPILAAETKTPFVDIEHQVDAVQEYLIALHDEFDPTARSQLQLVRVDYLWGNVKSILSRTARSHLEAAAFKRWSYSDPLENQSLHFDPSEDRRHAYRWNQPSGDPDLKRCGGMLGANRLAIEAVSLFPLVRTSAALQTVGFSGQTTRDTRWTWPIWSGALSLEVVRSLLALSELQQDQPNPLVCHRLGVIAVFRANRILVNKTPNLSPPVQVV
jgi:hypothetical protein